MNEKEICDYEEAMKGKYPGFNVFFV